LVRLKDFGPYTDLVAAEINTGRKTIHYLQPVTGADLDFRTAVEVNAKKYFPNFTLAWKETGVAQIS
jgi:hypothetical protein